MEPLLPGRPCLHHPVFTVNSPKGRQRTAQAKTMLKGIEQVKRKNKNSTRGFFIKSLPVLRKSQRGWMLKKDIWQEVQKALVVHFLFPGRGQAWTTYISWLCTLRFHLTGANHSPALCLGLSAIAKAQFLPGTIHRSDTNSPLATKTLGDPWRLL